MKDESSKITSLLQLPHCGQRVLPAAEIAHRSEHEEGASGFGLEKEDQNNLY